MEEDKNSNTYVLTRIAALTEELAALRNLVAEVAAARELIASIKVVLKAHTITVEELQGRLDRISESLGKYKEAPLRNHVDRGVGAQ